MRTGTQKEKTSHDSEYENAELITKRESEWHPTEHETEVTTPQFERRSGDPVAWERSVMVAVDGRFAF